MGIGQTDMHPVTAVFIVFEIIMLAFQLPFYLTKRDRMRKYYLILLILLIIKNVAMGLFPDPKIPITLPIQYALTYGAGFVMASYFPFYFYKAYEIRELRWHATKGVFILLHLPFFLVGAVWYFATGDINKAINYGLIIPGCYGVYLGFLLFKSIRNKFKFIERKDYFEVIGVYCAVIPYASLAFCAYYRISQVNEAFLTNGGFAVITMLFIRKSVSEVRADFDRLKEFENVGPISSKAENDIISNNSDVSKVGNQILDNEVFDPNMKFETKMQEFGLTLREKEVVRLLKLGYTNEEISISMKIQTSTVKKHLENIFKKVLVGNRVELIHRLEYWTDQ
ncbi:hypothetical protein Dfri01_59320 [Dyadobacter frigoris]|uniref:helix-turn-helix transcriptional regulator n=1 Tax=Dyadobacter frigoris TaxID=2576211 RepID=UPI0024A50A29|nr:helix-turn-helix transcriptional regulator [Dyadobacter frigoris]GLU56471.1 hypothetical protein Dfri01_59320 [Dyadobacter frigoris]